MVCMAKTCSFRDDGLLPPRCRTRACQRRKLDPRALVGLPLFDGLPPDQISHLLVGSSVEVFTARSLLFDAGMPADSFYILLKGRVKLFTITEDGKESIVEIVHPVSSFAEAAMFANGRYPVSAETIEGADIVRVRASLFLAGLRENPDMGRRILAALYRWRRRLEQDLHMLRELPPIRRLAGFLLALAPPGDGAAVVELPLKKAIIANRLGMEPESLSRVLVRLRDVGVRSKGRTVEIADLGSLRRLHADEPEANSRLPT